MPKSRLLTPPYYEVLPVVLSSCTVFALSGPRSFIWHTVGDVSTACVRGINHISLVVGDWNLMHFISPAYLIPKKRVKFEEGSCRREKVSMYSHSVTFGMNFQNPITFGTGEVQAG